MTDAHATLLAFLGSFGLLAGYAARVAIARQQARESKLRTPEPPRAERRPGSAVMTEQKPRSTINK